MRIRISALVASITLLGGLSAQAVAHPRHKLKLPADYAAWSQVVQCESGGWRVLGSAYPDPFGITAINWAGAGGKPMPVGPVPLGKRAAAIRIADRFRHQYGIAIPDQGGCHGSW